jgi:hypothetical protein
MPTSIRPSAPGVRTCVSPEASAPAISPSILVSLPFKGRARVGMGHVGTPPPS